MNNFFTRQSSRTYILLGVLTFKLSIVVFGLALGGGYSKQRITLFAFIVFCIGATNTYFYFKNLLNSNPRLRGGLVKGITALVVAFSFLYSIGMLFL